MRQIGNRAPAQPRPAYVSSPASMRVLTTCRRSGSRQRLIPRSSAKRRLPTLRAWLSKREFWRESRALTGRRLPNNV